MPRKGQTVAECAQSRDRVLCAIVDAHRAGRWPSHALIARLVNITTTGIKQHVNNLRDAHLLTARYRERGSLTITPEAFARRDALLGSIPVFAMPHRRRRQYMDSGAGGLTTRAVHGPEHFRRMGQIGGARFWRENPGAQARLEAARAMAAQKRKAGQQ